MLDDCEPEESSDRQSNSDCFPLLRPPQVVPLFPAGQVWLFSGCEFRKGVPCVSGRRRLAIPLGTEQSSLMLFSLMPKARAEEVRRFREHPRPKSCIKVLQTQIADASSLTKVVVLVPGDIEEPKTIVSGSPLRPFSKNYRFVRGRRDYSQRHSGISIFPLVAKRYRCNADTSSIP